MELKTIRSQTIALAGIAQAAYLVQQIARYGKADQDIMEASIGSILKVDSDSVEEIYGGLQNLACGFDKLQIQLSSRDVMDPEQARIAASLIFLENQLSSNKQMLKTISVGIDKATAQTEHFGLMHENVLANLADIYQNTVSTIRPRIIIQGEEEYLKQTEIANKIRSLLLAGIRSVFLWRQCGGTRWKFLFFRKKLQDETKLLLSEL